MVPIKRKFNFSNVIVASKTVLRKAEREDLPETLVKSVLITMPGTKFRRLKDKINKISRKKRELMPEDRDIIHRWWNGAQALITDLKNNPLCATLATKCNNAEHATKALCPAAVAGRISSLARLGLLEPVERDAIIARGLKRKMFSVVPMFSEDLLEEIKQHRAIEAADEKLRTEQHALLKKGMKVVPQFKKVPVDEQGQIVMETVRKGKTTVRTYNNPKIRYSAKKKISSVVAERAPTPVKETEFDLKFF